MVEVTGFCLNRESGTNTPTGVVWTHAENGQLSLCSPSFRMRHAGELNLSLVKLQSIKPDFEAPWMSLERPKAFSYLIGLPYALI
ncbi:hypothetical protein MHYP_G00267550 [Metynnis hypsauchen]